MPMELTLVLKACLLRAVSTLLTMVPCRGEGPHILLEQTSTTFEPNWKLFLRGPIMSGLTSLRTLTTSSWYKPLSVIPFTWNKKSMIPWPGIPVKPAEILTSSNCPWSNIWQTYWTWSAPPSPYCQWKLLHLCWRPLRAADRRHHHHIIIISIIIIIIIILMVDDHLKQLIDVITITSSSPSSSSL